MLNCYSFFAVGVMTMVMGLRLGMVVCSILALSSAHAADRILIFTKTAGTRENNIADSRKGLTSFYEKKGLVVDTSENGALFSDTGLARYQAVVFLKNTGDFLNNTQQTAFEKWFQAGGGVQIIHAALDAETAWPFYGKLIGGAWFKSLPGDSNTVHKVVITDTLDPSTKGLPRPWERKDEIYGFRANPRTATNPAMHILATVEDPAYRGGTPGTDNPMSWYCSYMGGRAWTTAMGHVTKAYNDSLFLGHLLGGMEYLLGHPTVAVSGHPTQQNPLRIRNPGRTAGVRFGIGGEVDGGVDGTGRRLKLPKSSQSLPTQ